MISQYSNWPIGLMGQGLISSRSKTCLYFPKCSDQLCGPSSRLFNGHKW